MKIASNKRSLKRASIADKKEGSLELVAELREDANKNISILTIRRMILKVEFKECKARKKQYMFQTRI